MQQTQQARAPQTQPFGEEAFGPGDGTTLRWLGMAGFLINSRGTTIMIDPLLEGFDMPIMIDMPIAATDVPELDAILVTHSDNDHYSVPTCRALAPVTNLLPIPLITGTQWTGVDARDRYGDVIEP